MMRNFIKAHLILFVVALIIAFILFPMYMFFAEGATKEQIQNYFQDAITFNRFNAWKIFLTWFIALVCGRLILLALKDPSADIDPKYKR